MIRRVVVSVAGLVSLFAASAYADEAACVSARYGAWGKYAGCEAKAAAKGFDGQAFLKCRQKYAAAWTKLGTKNPGTSCVGARFVDNGDGTITDNLTQLVWEKKDGAGGVGGFCPGGPTCANPHDVDNVYVWGGSNADGTVYTDFLATLNSTGFAGQHDWRLPTLVELQSTISTDALPCAAAPCVVDPIFLPTLSTPLSYYWTSSSGQNFVGAVATDAWLVDFTDGTASFGDKGNGSYVRAVRGGS